jgi:hypothetical protein
MWVEVARARLGHPARSPAASCWSALLPLGSYNTAPNLATAAIMLLVLATFLMNLARERAPASRRHRGVSSGSCSCLF